MGNNERLASVVGRAVIDSEFAKRLETDPKAAAESVGVYLTPEEIASLGEISGAKLTEVAGGIRRQMGPKALFDRQQQQRGDFFKV